jgi:hypothetical protein
VVPPRSTTTPSKKRFPVKSFWNSQVYWPATFRRAFCDE